METTESSKEYTRNSKEVIKEEERHLFESEKGRKIGLAVSGGGIRSASFGLGVMQGLVAKGLMKKVDYMSTVSGGGFLGSALTWALKLGGEKVGLDAKTFPLGSQKEISKNEDNKNYLLNYLRQHGNYLMPTHNLGMFSFVAVVFRSVIVSLAVYAALLTSVLVILNSLGAFYQQSGSWINIYLGPVLDWISNTLLLSDHNIKSPFFLLSFALAAFTLFLYLVFALRSSLPNILGISKYEGFLRGQTVLGYVWKFTLVFLVLGLIPVTVDFLRALEIEISGTTLPIISGVVAGLWEHKKSQTGESGGTLNSIIAYCGVFLLLFGILVGTFQLALSDFYVNDLGQLNKTTLLVTLISAIVLGALSNLNLISPHRIWRNRLMEIFMPNPEAVDGNKWEKAILANSEETGNMEKMCQPPHKKPYHIINTNVILVDSEESRYKNRGGDNFIISPLYSGSDATGWQKTDQYQHAVGRGGVTMATAVAASGAALNPNAGVSGEGFTKNAAVSMLLSLLNLGLGYWASNPKFKLFSITPNLLFPGIPRLFSEGLNEKKPLVQLSDGGHFENCGLYELIRRELDVIILSDGGADLAYNYDDLGNAIEKIRVDFGANVKFHIEHYGISELMPGSYYQKEGKEKDDPYDRAINGFAFGEITYANNKRGLLVLVKPAMFLKLATDVYSYKGIHKDFPQQTTADQFFDEKQFEAYRELGYSISWNMGKSVENPVVPWDNINASEEFKDLMLWFKQQIKDDDLK